MKSRKRLSVVIALFWIGFVFGRSAVYTSTRDYADVVYFVADLATAVAGILLGIDVFVSTETSVPYRINLPRNANRYDAEVWYDLIKVGGVVFLIVNSLFIFFTIWKIVTQGSPI